MWKPASRNLIKVPFPGAAHSFPCRSVQAQGWPACLARPTGWPPAARKLHPDRATGGAGTPTEIGRRGRENAQSYGGAATITKLHWGWVGGWACGQQNVKGMPGMGQPRRGAYRGAKRCGGVGPARACGNGQVLEQRTRVVNRPRRLLALGKENGCVQGSSAERASGARAAARPLQSRLAVLGVGRAAGVAGDVSTRAPSLQGRRGAKYVGLQSCLQSGRPPAARPAVAPRLRGPLRAHPLL